MHITLEEPVVIREVETLEEVWAGIETLRRSPVMDKWSTIRQSVLIEALPHIRASMRERLEVASPGLVAYIDERWEDLRRSSRIDLELIKRIGTTEASHLALIYSYWMYSSDILGRGKGWSSTNLGKQFGDPHNLRRELVSVAVQCPICGKQAQLVTSDLHPKMPWEYSFRCSSCDHQEQSGKYNDRLVRTQCHCQSCRSLALDLSNSLHPTASRIGHAIAQYLREKTISTIAECEALTNLPLTSNNFPAEVKSFAQASLDRPGAFLGDILDEVAGYKGQTWHPYSYYTRWGQQLRILLSYGVVTLEILGDIEEMDDQEILNLALIDRSGPRLSNPEERLQKKSSSLTALLRGFKANDPVSFIAWAKSLAEDLRLNEIWAPLPVQFLWETDLDRIREIVGVAPLSKSRRDNDHVFIHAIAWHYRRNGTDLYRAVRDFAKPVLDLSESSLWKSREDLFKRIVGGLRTELCAKLLRQLADLAPSVLQKTDDLEQSMRAGEKNIDIPNLYQKGGKELLNYLYWMHAREVIGEETGVTLKAIMDLYGIQIAQFRKNIDPLTLPWSCPCCGAISEIRGITIHKNQIQRAELSCEQCGHVESFDASFYEPPLESNAVICPCSCCKERRMVAYNAIRSAAPSLRNHLVDVLSEANSDLELNKVYIGGRVDKLVAALTSGYSLEESRRMLFSGTSSDNGQHDSRPTPEWAVAAVQKGILSVGKVERLSGEDARNFLWAEVLHLVDRLPEGGDPRQDYLERELQSHDQSIVFRAISDLLSSTKWRPVALPVRRKATVNWNAIDEYVAQGNLEGISQDELLAHILGDDAKRVDTRSPHTGWWPSRPSTQTDENVTTSRQPNDEEIAAVRLLENLGYVIHPPKD